MKYLASFLAPVLLAGLLPSIAAADDDRDKKGDKDGYDKRYGYDQRDGYDANDQRALRNLARDLDGLTRAALKEAKRQDRDRYRDGDRNRAIDGVAALDRLADEARSFRHQVDRSKKDPWSGRDEWYDVRDAYVDASNNLRGRRVDREVQVLLGRVEDTMDEIAHFYGGSLGDDWRRSDRRYEDRARYGDRRYDSDRYDDDYDRDGSAHRPH